ncbi:heme-binding protein [Candidatus Mycolicibacterium alkanivorans]|uniref:Heme-binding protein n=1 Tax=Candidatus Mycolicibacterium alkanivorans TaxID=2954114 RepID=A0ABS9YWV4_9MYCO|nr:heme-binding protein [Candidatus Mycolicibacterium alkanivorans]MCI4675704.1 heme-binding protein [Candidatus Mycolicibacterium alkanivorans]
MSSSRSVRRVAAAALGAGAVLLSMTGPAAAAPPPNCTTADMTGIMSGVSAAMAAYLFSHPDVNNFFTSLQGLPKKEVAARTQGYLDANPSIRADLDNIRQPSTDFRNRCGIGQRPLVPNA